MAVMADAGGRLGFDERSALINACHRSRKITHKLSDEVLPLPVTWSDGVDVLVRVSVSCPSQPWAGWRTH